MGTVSWLCSSSLVKVWVKAAVVCITHRFHHCFSTWSQRYLSLSLLPQRHWLPRDLRNQRGLSALGFTYCAWPITKHNAPLSQSTLVGSNHNAEREDKLCAKTIGYLRNPGSLIALSEVSHCGIRPFCVFLEALLHYVSPNWLADVTLCLGVASPPSV